MPRFPGLRLEPRADADAERGHVRGPRGGRDRGRRGRDHEARHGPSDGASDARRLHRARHVPFHPARPASRPRRRQVPALPAPRPDGGRGLAREEERAGVPSLHGARWGKGDVLICQVCGSANELDRDLCRKCQSKLLVVSGASETSYEEGSSGDEGVSLDEHLLERVSVLEEIVKRSAETLKMLLDALNRQEKNGFVAQTGLLALKDLLERKGMLVEEELLDLWETRVDHHMAVLEKRERFLERRERMVAGFGGGRKDRFASLLSDAEFAFFALEPD